LRGSHAISGLRIALCTDTYLPQVNGVVIAVKTFSEMMAQRGHDVAIFAPGESNYVTNEGGVEVHYFKGRIFRSYPDYVITPRMGSINRAIRDFNPDIVHVHTPIFVGVAGWWAGKHLDVPILMSFHTPIDRYVEYLSFARGPMRHLLSFIARLYQEWFHSRGDTCTFPTRMASGFVHLPRRIPVRVQPNGVDLERFNPNVDMAPVLSVYGIDGSPVVLYTGRVGIEKRIDVLLW